MLIETYPLDTDIVCMGIEAFLSTMAAEPKTVTFNMELSMARNGGVSVAWGDATTADRPNIAEKRTRYLRICMFEFDIIFTYNFCLCLCLLYLRLPSISGPESTIRERNEIMLVLL
jgi:hypothetical protein